MVNFVAGCIDLVISLQSKSTRLVLMKQVGKLGEKLVFSGSDFDLIVLLMTEGHFYNLY